MATVTPNQHKDRESATRVEGGGDGELEIPRNPRAVPPSNQHSVAPVLPEEIAKAVEAVRAIVQGEMDDLMAENKRLEEQLEALQKALNEIVMDCLNHERRSEIERKARAALAASSPATKTHGRGCPCTPCQAEDWDAVNAEIAAGLSERYPASESFPLTPEQEEKASREIQMRAEIHGSSPAKERWTQEELDALKAQAKDRIERFGWAAKRDL